MAFSGGLVEEGLCFQLLGRSSNTDNKGPFTGNEIFPSSNRKSLETRVLEHNCSYPRAASSTIRSVYLVSEHLNYQLYPYTLLRFGCFTARQAHWSNSVIKIP